MRRAPGARAIAAVTLLCLPLITGCSAGRGGHDDVATSTDVLEGHASGGSASAEATPSRSPVRLPGLAGSVRFGVIGDSGTGKRAQYAVANEMYAYYKQLPFRLVIMLGDNLYGGEDADDYRRKFEEPYRKLLDEGVEFRAALGNHDKPLQRLYDDFNMNGQRYYSFSPAPFVRFFALDSTYMEPAQLHWLEDELKGATEPWKIAFFHHPLYSTGKRHGPDRVLREVLEPLFVKYGVDVVFSGHEHFYERLKPQKGISYFISGNAGKLRRNGIRRTSQEAAGYAQGWSFMVCELTPDKLYFQAVSYTGVSLDYGVIEAPPEAEEYRAQK